MNRIVMGALLSAAAAVTGLPGANASSGPVLKSGSTYHMAVCGKVVSRAARCHAHVVTDAFGRIKHNTTPDGYGPADLRDAYKIAGTGDSSTIVAIVDAFGYTNAEQDLGVYRAQYGLPACTVGNGCFRKLNQKGKDGGFPVQDDGWALESALDVDMVSAMCPSCKIYLFEANTNLTSNLATAVRTAASMGAHVISNSSGGDESGSEGDEASYKQRGIAVTASSVDSGYGVSFPASSPHVIAVGGTSLLRDGSSRGWSETVWSGAGSGCSTVYAKPKWQKDKGCAMRTVADVSAVADPNTGVAVYGPIAGLLSGWVVVGGTSVAAPLIGGIYGLNGGRVTWGKQPYKGKAQLFDVTSGSNGDCGGTYLCTGEPGYDGPTGLGTPNGSGAF
jgi:subtilase family serine protease